MGDFFAPSPGYPPPPPEPDAPPPRIEDFATSFGIGVNKSGAIGAFWAPFVDACLALLAKGIGFILSILLKIFAFLIKLVGDVSNDAESGFGFLVAATLGELFGVEVDPATVATRVSGPDRQAVASKIGKTITNTLFSGVAANPAGGITPSDVAANQYLAVVMNMELNGWIESWVTDGLSAHFLEKYGDLKDGIARVLGLGRMSRQVFAAPLQVLVHRPYLDLLQQKYRNKEANEQAAVRSFFRGEIPRSDLSVMLGNQGYTEQQIEWAITDHQKFISDAQIQFLLSRGTWTDGDATQYLQQTGWDTVGAQTLVALWADQRTHKYRLQMVEAAEKAFIDGDIQIDQWQSIVESAGLTDDEQTWILKVAGMKREMKVTHLSLGQIEQGVLDGIMNLNDVKTWAQRVGMPADEEAYLELMILFKQNKESATAQAKTAAASAKAAAAKAKAAAATEKAAQAKALAPDKGVTVAQAETLVIDGLWTFDHLTAFLTAKGYGADAIDAIVTLLHNKITATAAKTGTATGVRAAAAAKGLNLAEVEKAVVAGILSITDLQGFLSNAGFDAADSQVIVELTEDALTSANVKAAAKAAAAAKAGKHSISLAALERAVRLGLAPQSSYDAALTAAGYDTMSITLLNGILSDQIAADKAAAAKKTTTPVAGAAKAPTLAQLEQEVIQGVRPIGDYTTALAALGYAPSDQTQLTQLLQVKVDHAKHAAALHSDAQGKAVKTGLSLAAAENAVINGVNQMADYDAMLTTLGYDDVDRQTLEALLLERVQAKAAKAGTSTLTSSSTSPSTSTSA